MNHQESDAKTEATPSQRAYIDMTIRLHNACFKVLAHTLGKMPIIHQNFAGMVAAQKTRECEILALVELLGVNKDAWYDKAAAIGERYATGIEADDAERANAAPRLAIATSLPPKGN